jgi:hypothetical protein
MNLLLLLLPPCTLGFAPIVAVPSTRQADSALFVGKGFGKSNSKKSSKKKKSPYELFERSGDDSVFNLLEDKDEATLMADFFKERTDWLPLFRSLADSSSSNEVPAMTHLDDAPSNFDFHLNDDSPWAALPAIPDDDGDKQVIGTFLDGTQAALSTLPALREEDDETDLAFLLEGKRMLAVSRFQVIRSYGGNEVDLFDQLFGTCWNEVTQLSRDNQPDTGSVILLPDFEFDGGRGADAALQQFCTTRLQQPLKWLGMDDIFEVASIRTNSNAATAPIPALRVLHKMSEIRDLSDRVLPTDEDYQ